MSFSPRKYWLNGSNIGNSTIFTFSRFFSQEISALIAAVSRVPELLVEWNAYKPLIEIVLFFLLQQKLAQLLVLPTPAQNK